MAEDARQITKAFLDSYLTAANLTKDDDATEAIFITCFAHPPYPMTLVFKDRGVDLIFVIETPTSEALPMGIGYIENVPITILTVDKPGITGTKLRWKGEKELRRIYEANPYGSLHTLTRMSDNEQHLGITTLYSVTNVLRFKRYS